MGITRTLTLQLATVAHSLFNSSTVPTLTNPSTSSAVPTLTNSSTSVPTIISTPANLPFSFIIPYNQSQECDIYGPICQTGSITVGVDLSSTTTTTTLPCSSYLTAQSSYLQGFEPFPGAIKPFFPLEWQTGFGRSPECRSYAQAWEKRGGGGEFTFSNCGSNNAVVTAAQGVALDSRIPPGVLNQIPFQVYECCGNCSVDALEVRLYYFPDETASTSCSNQTLHKFNNSTEPAKKQPQPLPGGSIAILSGYTFTSPTAYLEIVGTAAVSDQCGTVGAILTNPIIPIPPGQLSTYSPQFPFTIGERYEDPNGVIGGQFLGYANPLKTADLACPTFGLGLSTSDGVTYTTYGPPFLPIIIPPPQLLDLDPEWKRLCTGFLSNSPGLRSFAIFDPPRILTPAAGLFPTPAPAAIPALETPNSKPPAKPPAQPGKIKPPSIPKPTSAPDPPDPALPGSKAPSADPNTPSPAQPDTTDPKIGQPSAKPVDPNNVERPTADPAQLPNQESNLEKKSSNLGPIILSAFGGGDPQGETPQPAIIDPTPANGQQVPPIENSGVVPDDSVPPTPFTPKVITAAGQTFEANPTAISIAGATLLPGGKEITIAGTPISLAPSGTLVVGNSPIPIPIPAIPPKPAAVFTIADQTFTADPNGFQIAGTSVKAGAAPVTISGTPVSLGSSGGLVIGTSSFRIPDSKAAPTFTVGNQPFTANPSGFVLAGSTVLPGGAPITISGTKLSLNQDGGLIIGSSTIKLPAQTPTANTLTFGGFTITAGPSASGVVVDGATLVAGNPGTTISGTSISLNTDGNLIVGSKTLNLAAQTPAPNTFNIGGLTFTGAPSGSTVAIDGNILVPGGPGAIISGTSISLQPNGKLVVGSQTIPIPIQTPSSNTFTVGGLTFTGAPSGSTVEIGGTTLVPGGPGTTISGTPISIQPNGNLVVGSQTIPIPTQTPNSNTFTVGDLTFTAAPSASAIVIDGTTILPGSPGTTISGTSISLQPNGKLIVGSETINVPTQTPRDVFTTDGLTFTSEPSDILVGGATLVPGGPGATVSGTPVSVDPGGNLVVGSSTVSHVLGFEGGAGRVGVGSLGFLRVLVVVGIWFIN